MTETPSRLGFLQVIGIDAAPDPSHVGDLQRAGWPMEQIADTYGVSVRTVYRYLNDSYQCPGFPPGSCLTKKRGGGLCSFCRKTKALR